MSLYLIKRLDVTARVAHVLLREQLVYGLQLTDVSSYSSTGDLTARRLAFGEDGSCDSNNPQTFTSMSATFSNTMIGKYLTLFGTNDNNSGIHKIIGVLNSNTLMVQGGIYGSSFTTDVSIGYRVIDPANNNGKTEFTVQGRTGTSPVWQARFFMNSTDSRVIRFELGPNGGFTGGTRTGTGDSFTGTAPNMHLVDAAGTFLETDVGRYITITGATTGANNGTFLVTSYLSATEVVYTNASGVAEAFTGIWSIEGAWTLPTLTNREINQDPVANRWFLKLADTNFILWTENSAGTAAYNLAYLGACSTRRPAVDTDFAVIAAGTVPTLLGNIAALGSAVGKPQVVHQAIVYGDNANPPASYNMFTSLPPSNFDLRNDSADIAIGCEVAGNEEDDRGILHGIQWISDLIPYRTFVDNGRQLLSLGSGVAVEWDGSLAR
jgi:hypothetical protein